MPPTDRSPARRADRVRRRRNQAGTDVNWRVRLAMWLLDGDSAAAEFFGCASLRYCTEAQLSAELKRRRRRAQRLACKP